MTAFYFPVVTRREDFDELMADTQLFKRPLKKSRPFFFRAVHPCRELSTVIHLGTFNGIREFLHTMPDELCGRVGRVFLEGFQIAETAVFVDEGILVIITTVLRCVAYRVADQTCLWNEFHVDLYPLTGILHLL